MSPVSVDKPAFDIEPPDGVMPLDSRFYIKRDVDDECRRFLARKHAVTLFVQASRQMGKSSLMRRTLAQVERATQKCCLYLDFQKIPEQYFDDEEKFFIELCLMIGEALDIPEAIDKYWQKRRTAIMNCSRYMSKHIIPYLDEPLILAIDEVERMLASPFRANFFGMLRTWHNERSFDEGFARLSLFLSSSTEPYLLINDPHQSPFNVADRFELQDFTGAEVAELNRRHGHPLKAGQVDELIDLIAGHPFLTRLALYLLVTGRVANWEKLRARATQDDGPFGDHLRHYWLLVLNKPELKKALTQICREHIYGENQIFYRLRGAGLIKKSGQQVVLRNQLYDLYFKERLKHV